MNKKYFLGSLFTLPLLPLMYYQGKKIRASVPRLPEAKGNQGRVGDDRNGMIRLLTLGESTIAGVGVDSHETGFTGTLAKELSMSLQMGVDWKVFAKSGYTALRVTHKIVPNIKISDVDLIVVGLGGNDAFKLNSPSKWRLHITNLILALRSKFPNATIVFTNMPPIKIFPAFTGLIRFTVGNLVELLGEELADLVAQFPNVYYNAEVISLENWIDRLDVDAKPEDFFSDGVHPSKLTYQIWAKDLCRYILEFDVLKLKFLSKRN